MPRHKLLEYIATLEPRTIVMEACGGAHFKDYDQQVIAIVGADEDCQRLQIIPGIGRGVEFHLWRTFCRLAGTGAKTSFNRKKTQIVGGQQAG